jgi:hypothetical protein
MPGLLRRALRGASTLEERADTAFVRDR